MCFNKSLSAKLDDLFIVIVNVFITFINSMFSWNYLKIHSRLCTYSSNSKFWFKKIKIKWLSNSVDKVFGEGFLGRITKVFGGGGCR
jgi:hypothetical protein